MNTYCRKVNASIDIMQVCRVLVFVLLTMILCTVAIFLLPEKTAAAKNESQGTYRILSVEIEPGDSLWSIAEEYFTEDFGSVQSYIAEIKRMNGLTSNTLYTGNYLLIPCYQ